MLQGTDHPVTNQILEVGVAGTRTYVSGFVWQDKSTSAETLGHPPTEISQTRPSEFQSHKSGFHQQNLPAELKTREKNTAWDHNFVKTETNNQDIHQVYRAIWILVVSSQHLNETWRSTLADEDGVSRGSLCIWLTERTPEVAR